MLRGCGCLPLFIVGHVDNYHCWAPGFKKEGWAQLKTVHGSCLTSSDNKSPLCGCREAPAKPAPEPVLWLHLLLVPFCCSNKLPQTQWLQTTPYLFSYGSLGYKSNVIVTGLKSRIGRTAFLLEALDKRLFPHLFQFLDFWRPSAFLGLWSLPPSWEQVMLHLSGPSSQVTSPSDHSGKGSLLLRTHMITLC